MRLVICSAFVAVLAFLGGTDVLAAAEGTTLSDPCAKADTQYGLNQCYDHERESADTRLNKIY